MLWQWMSCPTLVHPLQLWVFTFLLCILHALNECVQAHTRLQYSDKSAKDMSESRWSRWNCMRMPKSCPFCQPLYLRNTKSELKTLLLFHINNFSPLNFNYFIAFVSQIVWHHKKTVTPFHCLTSTTWDFWRGDLARKDFSRSHHRHDHHRTS